MNIKVHFSASGWGIVGGGIILLMNQFALKCTCGRGKFGLGGIFPLFHNPYIRKQFNWTLQERFFPLHNPPSAFCNPCDKEMYLYSGYLF